MVACGEAWIRLRPDRSASSPRGLRRVLARDALPGSRSPALPIRDPLRGRPPLPLACLADRGLRALEDRSRASIVART